MTTEKTLPSQKIEQIHAELAVMGVRIYEVNEGEFYAASSADKAHALMLKMTGVPLTEDEEVREVDDWFYQDTVMDEGGEGSEIAMMDVLRQIHASESGFPEFICSNNC